METKDACCQREPEITRMVNVLDNIIESLGERITTLSDRLECVCRSEPTAAKDNTAAPASAPQTTLGRALEEHCLRLSCLAERLEAVTAALEL